MGANGTGVRPDVHGFSPALTSFVGRTEAIRDLADLLDAGRLVTVLFISVRTVRSHLDRIRDKTGSRRRADLTRLAMEEGIV